MMLHSPLQPCPYKNYPILFVDDEEFILLTFQHLFRDEFTLHTAGDGKEALNVIKQHPEIVLLISDYRMPRMDGLELFTRVAQERPAMINILMTAYSESSLLMEAFNKGNLFRYITKPYDDKILRQEIMQGIEQSRLIKERDTLFLENIELMEKMKQVQQSVEMTKGTTDLIHNMSTSLKAVNHFLEMIPQKKMEKDPDFWQTSYALAKTEGEKIRDTMNDFLQSFKSSVKENGKEQ
jgi:DNA-binding NtrC family response regulator